MVEKFLIKPQLTKTSQDNNLNYIHFLKHFYEYHTKKLKYNRDVTCLILKVLPWWICNYCFCSHIQSLVELESIIVATTPYFKHTAPLTYSLWESCALPRYNAVSSWAFELFTYYTSIFLRYPTFKCIF